METEETNAVVSLDPKAFRFTYTNFGWCKNYDGPSTIKGLGSPEKAAVVMKHICKSKWFYWSA